VYRETPADRFVHRLREGQRRLDQRRQVERRLGQIEGERADAADQLRRLRQEKADTGASVERLEQDGLKSFLLDLLGRREGAIDDGRRLMAKQHLLLRSSQSLAQQLDDEVAVARMARAPRGSVPSRAWRSRVFWSSRRTMSATRVRR